MANGYEKCYDKGKKTCHLYLHMIKSTRMAVTSHFWDEQTGRAMDL